MPKIKSMVPPSPVSVAGLGRAVSNFLPAWMPSPPIVIGRCSISSLNFSCRRGYSYGYRYNDQRLLLRDVQELVNKKSRLLPHFSSPLRNFTTSSSLASTSSLSSTTFKMSSEEITHPTIVGMLMFLFPPFFSILLPRVALPLSHDDHTHGLLFALASCYENTRLVPRKSSSLHCN